ncbi:MAG TPA: hypothetical protein VHY83_08605 [Solirubrobacteraceae bacterium]|nr:hypothetical protein [Solirubrobacteraceae bacterium]
MRSKGSRERGSRTRMVLQAARRRRRRSTRTLSLLALAIAASAFGAFSASASAQTDSTAVTIPGSPLTTYVGPRGECQSSYLVNGEIAGNFYYGGNQVGDCGFFLAFPKAGTGQPVPLQGKTFGFDGAAGPHLASIYETVSQSPVTGAGTEASPYSQTTVFLVKEGTAYAEITEVTTYVNGSPQFTSTYTVKNVSASKIYFRAMYAGDLYVNGSDVGIGVFLGGPPRFIGGQNTASGVIGGFQEVTPWSAFQEAYWATPFGEVTPTDNGIWHDVENNLEGEKEKTFNETIEPIELDNGAGVEWDEFRTKALEPGASTAFTIINRTQIPSQLKFSPANQTLTQGQTETITATATDTANTPYAGKALRYTVTGGNPQSGAVTLNGAGQAQISYVGNNPGFDTIQMYVDLGGTGVQTSGDPSGTATVTFLPKPPPPATPNSSYKIQSIKANSNGTITIVFVPTQGGTGTLEVTVPTATISRHAAEAAKKKCKKGLVRIKGKCRPPTTLSGRVSATGVAGVPLGLTVNASNKVKNALKKGRTVSLTAKLTYKSALGGTPTVQTFHFTVKPKKKKKH